jgi:hypothetical protein
VEYLPAWSEVSGTLRLIAKSAENCLEKSALKVSEIKVLRFQIGRNKIARKLKLSPVGVRNSAVGCRKLTHHCGFGNPGIPPAGPMQTGPAMQRKVCAGDCYVP